MERKKNLANVESANELIGSTDFSWSECSDVSESNFSGEDKEEKGHRGRKEFDTTPLRCFPGMLK